MNLSDDGRAFIRKQESCRLEPYYDQNGLATIGWGHLLTMTPHAPLSRFPPISQAEADRLFDCDVAPTESGVSQMLAGIALKQAQFDALVSLAFNIGLHAFGASSLRAAVEEGQPLAVIRADFAKWNKIADPKTGALIPSAGLTARRAAEADLYASAA